MPLKCCVPLCKSNYKSEKEVTSIYKLPKDESQRSDWIKAIPRANLVISKNTAVCRKHWPENCDFVSVNGKRKPANPPSIFANVPESCLRPVQKKRPTKLSSSVSRNIIPDEMSEFRNKDILVLEEIFEKYSVTQDVNVFTDAASSTIIQSTVLNDGVPEFVIKIHNDLTFDTYHYGSSCVISTLKENSITKCKYWSTLEEILRYLKSKEKSHKSNILMEHVAEMGKSPGVSYDPEVMTRAFEYFSISRELYSRLCVDYQLPSIRTLTRVTTRTNNAGISDYIHQIFNSLQNWQKRCIILWDEVYIKPAMTYSAGSLFGKATDHPEKLAKTVLSIMINCLYGGPEFIAKALPVSNLTGDFLFEEGSSLVDLVKASNGKVLAIIADGHKTNQKCFKSLNTIPGKPWLLDEDTFLLYDYVHIIKCIRNNWLTERCGELEYKFNGQTQIAKWRHLKLLYEAETNSLIKLSKLNMVAVAPKPIERQKVSTCLKIFCDETISALSTHPRIDHKEVEGTVNFLKIVLRFWKIMNVRSIDAGNRFNDPDRDEIRSVDDERLNFLSNFAKMADGMKKKGRVRCRQFTVETSTFISHVCYGFIDLAKYLLKDNDYILLGWFTTDPLEKYFSKLRQGSGGTYFITAQSVIEKVKIHRAKLGLKQNGVFNANEDNHKCDYCDRDFTADESDLLEHLIELESKVSVDTIMGIIYIAGYIEFKHGFTDEPDTTFYFQKYGKYFDDLNKGSLRIPNDNSVQWSIFCLIFFTSFNSNVCRNFYITAFQFIAKKYGFSVQDVHCKTLSNILLKNLTIKETPYSSREGKVKVLKLS